MCEISPIDEESNKTIGLLQDELGLILPARFDGPQLKINLSLLSSKVSLVPAMLATCTSGCAVASVCVAFEKYPSTIKAGILTSL